MLCFRYVRDKVNCLLYIFFFLQGGYPLANISIFSCFPWPNSSTEFGLVQLVPPLLL